jgi:exonuclease VII small subunit
MVKETESLQKSKDRLEEIAKKFREQSVSIDEIIPLIEESIKIYDTTSVRLEGMQKALEEKLGNRESKD